VSKEVFHRSESASSPGLRTRTGGAGGHHRTAAIPGPVPRAARGRSHQLRIVRRGAPASPSRPQGQLPSHPIAPARVAGIKEENR